VMVFEDIIPNKGNKTMGIREVTPIGKHSM